MLRALRTTAALAFAAAVTIQAASAATLLNVSYDPTREFYAEYNTAFAAYWKKKTGEDVTVQQSHGSSGAQSRAVIEGLEADVVTLALAYDIDAIASKSKAIAPDWAKRLPDNSSPYTSSIVFLVRKGNPKHIRDWNDVAKPGVGVITPNPKTSGAARWNVLAAYSYGLKRNHNDEAKARALVGAIYKNALVLDSASRASTVTFTERGLGDVLVSWENEAILAQRQHPNDYQIVVPSVSILAEPPVAWVDANVAKHHTEALAKAYLEYLYTPAAQKLACKWGYRPRLTSVLGTCGTSFARTDLTTIANFGGWNAAAARFFADGGIFDQVYSAK
jgi:sulfate/thiosulfate transport system substrate-binding protein